MGWSAYGVFFECIDTILNWTELSVDQTERVLSSAGGKTTRQKDIMWNLMNYGQQFFSSDV